MLTLSRFLTVETARNTEDLHIHWLDFIRNLSKWWWHRQFEELILLFWAKKQAPRKSPKKVRKTERPELVFKTSTQVTAKEATQQKRLETLAVYGARGKPKKIFAGIPCGWQGFMAASRWWRGLILREKMKISLHRKPGNRRLQLSLFKFLLQHWSLRTTSYRKGFMIDLQFHCISLYIWILLACNFMIDFLMCTSTWFSPGRILWICPCRCRTTIYDVVLHAVNRGAHTVPLKEEILHHLGCIKPCK